MIVLVLRTMIEQMKKEFGVGKLAWITFICVYGYFFVTESKNPFYVCILGSLITMLLPKEFAIRKMIYVIPQKRGFLQRYILTYGYIKMLLEGVILTTVIMIAYVIGKIDGNVEKIPLILMCIMWCSYSSNCGFDVYSRVKLSKWMRTLTHISIGVISVMWCTIFIGGGRFLKYIYPLLIPMIVLGEFQRFYFAKYYKLDDYESLKTEATG